MFQVVVVLHSGYIQISDELSLIDAEALAEALVATDGELIASCDIRKVSQ